MAEQKPSILERLAQVAESLAELRIITGVGEVQIQVDADENVRLAPTSEQITGLYSNINLVTGDIVTLIDKAYEGADNPIMAFHDSQVENGRKIVSTNIQTIERLATSDKVKELFNGPSGR